MKVSTAQKIINLDEQITAANNGDPQNLDEWKANSEIVLRHAVGDDDQLVRDFRDIRYGPGMWTERTPDSVFRDAERGGVREGIALLKAAKLKVEISDDVAEEVPALPATPLRSEIFIVHGHDVGRREMVARFVQSATGREPHLFGEQSLGSETIIETLERLGGTAAFAVVIATGDDVGRRASEGPDHDRPRARQNVILELGYFFGLLGRRNVALLFAPDVERPSDTDGILRIPLDTGAQWKIDLANHLEAAGFEIDRANALR